METQPNVLLQIIVLAALIEATVQTVKPIWQPAERTAIFFVNLGVGMAMSVGINYLAGLDLFSAIGVPLVRLPIVGTLLTGLLLSRGANFVHDLIQISQKIKLRVDPEVK